MTLGPKPARQRFQSGPQDGFAKSKTYREDISCKFPIKVTTVSTGGRTQHCQATKLFILELLVLPVEIKLEIT